MAVGDKVEIGVRSYVAIGKEATFGTYASATTALEVISIGIREEIESQRIESLNCNRGMTKRIQTLKNTGGTLEMNLQNQESILLIATAMGGPVTTASLTAGAFAHTITAGDFNTTTAINSLSFNVRKGSTTTWRYTGGRVNQLTISGAVGEPIKLSAEMVFQDATQQADDIKSSLSISTLTPWVYHQAQYIYAPTAGSLTTTNAEPIQSFELVINNNIVSDAPARQLGSLVPAVLPATTRSVELTINQRFDTTTSWNRYRDQTQGAIRIQMDGISITAEANHQMQIDLVKVFNNTADPEIGGAAEIISNEITFDVLVDDPNTTTGKDIVISVTNDVASY